MSTINGEVRMTRRTVVVRCPHWGIKEKMTVVLDDLGQPVSAIGTLTGDTEHHIIPRHDPRYHRRWGGIYDALGLPYPDDLLPRLFPVLTPPDPVTA